MIRALEDDFKKVVGIRQVTSYITWIMLPVLFSTVLFTYPGLISEFVYFSWYLWIFVVIFLLLNVNGMPFPFEILEILFYWLLLISSYCSLYMEHILEI